MGHIEGEIIVMPDGGVYSGSEDSMGPGHGPPARNLIASYRAVEHNDGLVDPLGDAELNPQLSAVLREAHASRQLGARQLSAVPEGSGNAENIAHLQLIRLFPEAQGIPIEPFYLDNAFVKRDVPQLEFRETFYDTVQTAQYRARLEQAPATKTPYDEVKYDLPKLVDKVYTPIEDLYRTIINPQEVDLRQIRWGMKRRRNLAALEAIQEIAEPSGTYPTVNHPLGLISSGNYHSDHNVGNQLSDWMSKFADDNDVEVTHLIMHPKVFADYCANTWTLNGAGAPIQPGRMPTGGIAPMPGLQGITAIIDKMVEKTAMYAINFENALRLAEGPKLMRRYYDEERDAHAIKITDFHQYLCVQTQTTKLERKWAGKISLTS